MITCTIVFPVVHYQRGKWLERERESACFTWIMLTSLAPSPMARVMEFFTFDLTILTTSAFCDGDTLGRRERERRREEKGRDGEEGRERERER